MDARTLRCAPDTLHPNRAALTHLCSQVENGQRALREKFDTIQTEIRNSVERADQVLLLPSHRLLTLNHIFDLS